MIELEKETQQVGTMLKITGKEVNIFFSEPSVSFRGTLSILFQTSSYQYVGYLGLAPIQDLVVALSIFVHVVGDGAMVLCMALNQLKEGLFERFLMEARGHWMKFFWWRFVGKVKVKKGGLETNT